MAKGLNKVLLLGNAGHDPVIRYTPIEGRPVVHLNLYQSEVWKDSVTGEKKERIERHRVILFNKLAEIAFQWIRKGSKIYVEGQLKTRSWVNNLGKTCYATDVYVKNLLLLDRRELPTASTQDQTCEAEPLSNEMPILEEEENFIEFNEITSHEFQGQVFNG